MYGGNPIFPGSALKVFFGPGIILAFAWTPDTTSDERYSSRSRPNYGVVNIRAILFVHPEL
jgi:hypothetical protein